MKYKSLTDSQRKGFDLIAKLLNKKYPFIVGWDEYDGWEDFKANLYLNLVIDMNKYKEYFEGRISEYISTEPQVSLGYPLTNLSNYKKANQLEKEISSMMIKYYEYLPQDYVVRYKPSTFIEDFIPRTLRIGEWKFIKPPSL